MGLFAALTGVGAWVQVPLGPVPLTLQTLFVLLAGITLGPRLGALSQVVYVAVGLAGAPVFAGGMGGPVVVLRPTFGYLMGFVAGAYLVGHLSQREELTFLRAFISCLIGLAAIYACGVPYLWFSLHHILGKQIDLDRTLWVGLVIFLPGAMAKTTVTAVLGPKLKKAVAL